MAQIEERSYAEAMPARAERRSGGRWPLWGAAAGVLGIVGTIVTDVRPEGKGDGDSLVTAADMEGLSRSGYHLGVVAGYLAVAALLVFAAAWRRSAERFLPESVAARVVANGLIASAGALMLGYGFKGAMAVYLPGGMDADAYGDDGLFVYYVLNDFGAYYGWVGVSVAAVAMAWLALRERAISRWIGVLSIVAVLPPLTFLLVTGLPGFPGMVGGLWLTVASLGLAWGKSPLAAR